MTMTTLDPNSIIVRDRQRKTPEDLDEGFVRSVNQRLIHPIVIRRENTETVRSSCEAQQSYCEYPKCDGCGFANPILVAGGMRLAALIKGGTTSLTEGVHFRFMDDLSPLEAQKIELEENVKRLDLPWREHVGAFGKIHALYSSSEENWSALKTAGELNLTERMVHILLAVYKNLDSPLLKDSTGIRQSYSILQTAADRRTAAIVNDIASIGTGIFSPTISSSNGVPNGSSELNGPISNSNNSVASSNSVPESPPVEQDGPTPNPIQGSVPVPPKDVGLSPIIRADFLQWAPFYTGPKFTLIHCDFPYGVDFASFAKSIDKRDDSYDSTKETYDTLLDSFCENLDKFCSYSAHVIFWFDMNFYCATKSKLEAAGLRVDPKPIVWFKSDNSGNVPRGDYFRRVYETALFCTRGNRTIIRAVANCYAAPTSSNPIHPSHKSESMLRHFLSGVIDETTDVLDPTCGSGSALRAAEDLGARSILGLELNPDYAAAANSTTLNARNLRKVAIRL